MQTFESRMSGVWSITAQKHKHRLEFYYKISIENSIKVTSWRTQLLHDKTNSGTFFHFIHYHVNYLTIGTFELPAKYL